MTDEQKKQENAKIELDRVEAELTFDPRRSSNSLHMKIADTCVGVSENGVEVGSVDACIGGSIELCYRGMHWTIDPRALWESFRDAIDLYLTQHPDLEAKCEKLPKPRDPDDIRAEEEATAGDRKHDELHGK